MKSNAKILGVSGVARAGKDTFAALTAKSLWARERFPKIKQLAFADKLKEDVNAFLQEHCGVADVSALSGEAKTDIRPFLVWYGCYMRKKDPGHWIKQVALKMEEDNDTDLFVITDNRFPNEVEWVHSLGGAVVHVKRYLQKPHQTTLLAPPNPEEAINDPLVDMAADVHVRWPTVTDININLLMPYVEKALAECKILN
jgi:hypothetical protein